MNVKKYVVNIIFALAMLFGMRIMALLDTKGEAMENMKLVAALLDAARSGPYGDSCSFKLGYVMETLAAMADRYPEVAEDLRQRLNQVKGN
jgi:hypothetical protein